ncbi:hypothetical protein EJB05_39909 [Eragrostis curvula]|uniref:Uncharacterized protein n=1 Tax=Eragrostis curvula TaxID=38414 RepID=A0A5J9TYC9_9POAL|nr:hypothetical protein EJB05_39909 [Eragrostis curvula]
MTSISGELAWTEVARELPGIDMEFAGDQSKRSSVRGRNISSWHYLREVKKSVAKEGKNRSTRDEEEEDRMIVDEEECDQDSFRMYQSGWEQCFGPSYGSFDKNTKKLWWFSLLIGRRLR